MKHKETEKHLPNLSYSTNFSDFFFQTYTGLSQLIQTISTKMTESTSASSFSLATAKSFASIHYLNIHKSK